MDNKYVLAMYDVRGIQNYIFRTPKLKDAIGASAIVEDIIQDALKYSVEKVCKESNGITHELDWELNNQILEYIDESKDVQVLYIGGGNAFVIYSSKELCVSVNKIMSKYIIENTYSLQLAIAVVDKTDDYKSDYNNIYLEMAKVKANMPDSKPVGAIPIMEIEPGTGLPITKNKDGENVSEETFLKKKAEEIKRKEIVSKRKMFDNYIEQKGDDSTLAVVHIDGNNMGLRIRDKISNIYNYPDAVREMRNISFNINHSYKDVFEQMADLFNQKDEYYVLKVLTAGDDITYVCTGKIAIATVEYFVNHITEKTMTGNFDDKEKYGFSVCAGISYFRSHFPFSIAYQVAEACCDSAKDRAKRDKEKYNENVGNYFDFQFCKNVQTLSIDDIRCNEYKTASGENLIIRPYAINSEHDYIYNFENLRKALDVFTNLQDKNKNKEVKNILPVDLPRSHAKTLRNTYSMGKSQISVFKSFLESRNWIMPDGDLELYTDDNIAKYYDALELMDMYVDLKEISKNEGEC